MLQDLFDLLFPKTCACCEHFLMPNERSICTHCRNELPLTDPYLENGNETEKVFYGRVRIVHAISLLQFEKHGITQRLMHDLKYRGNHGISSELGKWVGNDLLNIPWHKEVEVVIPVPLHRKRLRKRGYNQVEGFGKNIAEILNIPYNDRCLLKIEANKTQVFKNLAARFQNVEHSFELNRTETEMLKNKHVLLVDDIITTGATLETCAQKLLAIPNVKVSIATMARTQRGF
ncbi:MAG TPA: ComF family protein [Flavobacteriaceae bacterium]|nr:ComF family protein [Flavobacteriaceae bacterium]